MSSKLIPAVLLVLCALAAGAAFGAKMQWEVDKTLVTLSNENEQQANGLEDECKDKLSFYEQNASK